MATNITNSLVIEKAKSLGKNECAKWLQEIHQTTSSAKPHYMSYVSSITSCQREHSKLIKSKNRDSGRSKYDTFMCDTYVFPEASPQLKKPKDREIACNCSYREACIDIAIQLKEKNTENEQLKSEITNLKKTKVSKLTVKKMKADIVNNKRLVRVLESRLKSKNASLRRIRLKQSRAETKNIKLKVQLEQMENNVSQLKENINQETAISVELQEEVQRKQAEYDNIVAERDWLAEMVEDNELSFYDENGNKYLSELRECIYMLLELNVSAQNVEKVIRTVLKLVNKHTDRLPSKSTVLNMNVERLVLSQTQLNEQLPDKTNLTLYTDETTKFGTKYSGYHTSDTEGRMYVLGLRQLVTKSGQDTLSVLNEILQDIDDRSKEADMTAKRILINISATMSDRASTEKKFNELLQELRSNVLPELHGNWNALSEEDQVAASSVLNFFCGLHGLVHFAESANQSLAECEKGFFQDRPIHDKSFLKAKESGALRLVRTACKALARGADEKSGKFKDFSSFVKDFLSDNGMHSLPLQPFRGNRFNILFESAASLFFLHQKIREFLSGNQTNNLLKSVLFDIQVPEYMAGVKALALISRLVTGPLWSLLEDRTIHVFDMNIHYLQLVIFLNEAATDMESFITGKMKVFGDATVVKHDPILESLLAPWEHDDKVIIYLQVALPALAELSRKMYADHLPGGQWEHFTDEMKGKASGTQKHNKFAESAFGYLDQLLRKKPNVSVLASEAYLMFSANRTHTWLNEKDEHLKKHLIEEAMRDVKRVRSDFQQRKSEIERKHKEAVALSIEKAKALEQKRIQKLERYTDRIIYYGLWQSEDAVDSALRELDSVTEKKEALKCQLNFRKHVLKQNPSDGLEDVYRFSKSENGKRKDLTTEELTTNVKKLVAHAFTITAENDNSETDRVILTGKMVEHKFAQNGEEIWYKGRVISQVPGYQSWFNIVYDEDPAVYTYQLLKDYQEACLKITVN